MRLLLRHLNPFSTAITSPPPNHKYLALIAQLKDPLYFRHLLEEQERVRRMDSGQYCSFRAVRTHINQLLHLGRLVRWGQAYHTTIAEDKGKRRVQELIQLAFSERVSLTHQNIEEEEGADFQTIHFYLYFQLTPERAPQVSMLYLNYMQILRKRWPIELSRAQEALLQGRLSQTQRLILHRSNSWLDQIGLNNKQKIKEIKNNNVMIQFNKPKYLDEIDMSLIIGYYKRHIFQLDSSERQIVVYIFDLYLQKDELKGEATNSYLHLENIVFILYLLMNNFNATDKFLNFMTTIFSKPPSPTSIYLLELFAHQDKLSCLKVDLWLFILKEVSHPLKQMAYAALNKLFFLSLGTWRYKYLVWLFDSVACASIFGYQLLEHIQKVITTHKLDEQQSLDSYLIAFRRVTDFNRNGQIPQQVINMETANALWLCGQQDSELLSQPHAVLCEMLPHADGHPFLQQLYLPFLSRLLQLSLGNFSWPLLTQLYYFGLRWKAPASEQGHWRMQYVRRYIMSQYSSMGIRRRQIPQSSYFYKIHEQTTPDAFYSSFENQ